MPRVGSAFEDAGSGRAEDARQQVAQVAVRGESRLRGRSAAARALGGAAGAPGGASDRIAETCRTAALVIIAKDIPDEASCPVYDIKKLRSSGALAVFPQDTGLKLLGAKDYSGARLWSGAD